MTHHPAGRLPRTIEMLGIAFSVIATIFVFLQYLDLSIHLALFTSWFLVMALGKYLNYSYEHMQKGLIKGIDYGMEAVLVLIAVGALIGSWMAAGIVPNIIYYGLSVMSPEIFLFAAFIICAVTSLATGTSFGTIGTAGVAMMGIGIGFGLPLPLVAGAAISGAYVGDKLSPLSDTTVMAASLCQVNLIEHIKSMLTVSVPAIIGAALLFLVVGFFFVETNGDTRQSEMAMLALAGYFTIGWYMLLPALLVIALLILKLPSVPVITFGAVLGVIWAILFQDLPAVDAINTLYIGNHIHSDVEFLNILLNRGGMVSMFPVIVLVLFALGLGGLMESIGMLQALSNSLQHWANTAGKLTLATLLAGIAGNVLGGAAYVSLITASTITVKSYDRLGIDRRVLSRNVEAGGTVTTPMVPWSDGGVFMATTLGVSTLSYLPFMWYPLLVVVISLFYGFANIAIWREPPGIL